MERIRTRERLTNSHTCTTGFSYRPPTGKPSSSYQTFSWNDQVRERCVDQTGTANSAYQALKRNRRKGILGRSGKRILEWAERTQDLGGGLLDVQRVSTAQTGGHVDVSAALGYTTYTEVGDIAPCTPVSLPTYLGGTSSDELFLLGAGAIQMAAPNNPHASLAVMLKELKTEGLPSLPGLQTWKERAKHSLQHRAGGEYLNVQFGWKPLVNDLMNCMESIHKGDAIWRQFQRDAGRPVRRRRTLVDLTEVQTSNLGLRYPYPMGNSRLLSKGTLLETVTTNRKIWFSGCFRYVVPPNGSTLNRAHRELKRLRLLYGLDVDPLTLWNAMPWSWLADWLVDLSTLLGALSNLGSDSMVLQYGYLMEHITETKEYVLRGCAPLQGGYVDPGVYTVTRESKRRVHASPFGFGVDIATLTPKQWSILAAIGFTKRP